MRPDTSLFFAHLSGSEFQAGVDRGQWGISTEAIEASWPFVIIWIDAAAKTGCQRRYYFKFDLGGYPSAAPTACPWDDSTNTRLANSLWPKGSKFVSKTFNFSWNPNALYAPCDRVAMVGHEIWKTQFPEFWWQPTFQITVYLNFLHHLLHSSDYVKA